MKRGQRTKLDAARQRLRESYNLIEPVCRDRYEKDADNIVRPTTESDRLGTIMDATSVAIQLLNAELKNPRHS